jgi:hypothetical protein
MVVSANLWGTGEIPDFTELKKAQDRSSFASRPPPPPAILGKDNYLYFTIYRRSLFSLVSTVLYIARCRSRDHEHDVEVLN